MQPSRQAEQPAHELFVQLGPLHNHNLLRQSSQDFVEAVAMHKHNLANLAQAACMADQQV